LSNKTEDKFPKDKLGSFHE